MKVADLMRKEFVSLQASDKLEDVVKTFAREHITSAPVQRGNSFIGIVSDTDLVRYFMPKKFSFLWKKDKPTPIEELRKATAGKLARMPDTVLKPDQDVLDVLPLLAQKTDCVPVAENMRIVGLVRGDDIVKFFLKELAMHEITETAPGGSGAQEAGTEKELSEAAEWSSKAEMLTGIDRILSIVEKEGEAPAWKIAKETGIPTKSVESLGSVLERHHLVRMKYTFTKGVVLTKMEHGGK